MAQWLLYWINMAQPEWLRNMSALCLISQRSPTLNQPIDAEGYYRTLRLFQHQVYVVIKMILLIIIIIIVVIIIKHQKCNKNKNLCCWFGVHMSLMNWAQHQKYWSCQSINKWPMKYRQLVSLKKQDFLTFYVKIDKHTQ